jgi:hypothetical protein
MKLKKILASCFFGIEGFAVLVIILSMINLGNFVNTNVVGYIVSGIFLLFLNIISAFALLKE